MIVIEGQDRLEAIFNLVDDHYCHIDDGSGERSYCGKQEGPITCPSVYDGGSVCQDCGLPICPSCMTFECLDYELDEA